MDTTLTNANKTCYVDSKSLLVSIIMIDIARHPVDLVVIHMLSEWEAAYC